MKNMILISGVFANKEISHPSFRMVPVGMDCPYLEAQFDPTTKVLTVALKQTVIERDFVVRRDANGDPLKRTGAKRENQPLYQMVMAEQVVNHLFHIIFPNEVEAFIKMFAINDQEYDYARFLVGTNEEIPVAEQTLQVVQ